MHSWRICIVPQMLCLIPRTWKLPDTTLSMMRTMMNDGSRKLHRQRRNRRATWAGNYWQGLFLEVPHHLLRYRGLFSLRARPKTGITPGSKLNPKLSTCGTTGIDQMHGWGKNKLTSENTRSESLKRMQSGLWDLCVLYWRVRDPRTSLQA